MRDVKSPSDFFAKSPGAAQTAPICFGAPFEFMKSLERSTIFVPRHVIVSRSVSVTRATTVASRFSFPAREMNFSASSGAQTTAILSCDSDIASSVPPSPSYFFVT